MVVCFFRGRRAILVVYLKLVGLMMQHILDVFFELIFKCVGVWYSGSCGHDGLIRVMYIVVVELDEIISIG